MEHRHHQDAALLEPHAVLLGDLDVGLDDLRRGDPAQTDDHLRAYQPHLRAQPFDALLLLLGLGVAVLRRTALDDVRDIDVRVAVKLHRVEHLVEQLARSADERLSLQVLVLTRTLADEHHLGARIAHAHDDVGSGLAKLAFLAALAGCFQVIPICIHKKAPYG